MTTIFTHAVIPLTAGVALGDRVISRRLIILGMLCSMLPDLDALPRFSDYCSVYPTPKT